MAEAKHGLAYYPDPVRAKRPIWVVWGAPFNERSVPATIGETLKKKEKKRGHNTYATEVRYVTPS
jgi:hypothetical protein